MHAPQNPISQLVPPGNGIARNHQKLSFGPKEVDSACSLRKNKSKLRKHKVVHFMHHKTQSHNGYLPATESRETIQKLSFGPKEVDSACSLRKNKTQVQMHKVVHFMHPKTRSHNLYLPATESRETTQKLSFGLKKWIGHVRCEKTRRNFGNTKWCIVCTPKPDLTTGTSRLRNRTKPPKNLVWPNEVDLACSL